MKSIEFLLLVWCYLGNVSPSIEEMLNLNVVASENLDGKVELSTIDLLPTDPTVLPNYGNTEKAYLPRRVKVRKRIFKRPLEIKPNDSMEVNKSQDDSRKNFTSVTDVPVSDVDVMNDPTTDRAFIHFKKLFIDDYTTANADKEEQFLGFTELPHMTTEASTYTDENNNNRDITHLFRKVSKKVFKRPHNTYMPVNSDVGKEGEFLGFTELLHTTTEASTYPDENNNNREITHRFRKVSKKVFKRPHNTFTPVNSDVEKEEEFLGITELPHVTMRSFTYADENNNNERDMPYRFGKLSNKVVERPYMTNMSIKSDIDKEGVHNLELNTPDLFVKTDSENDESLFEHSGSTEDNIFYLNNQDYVTEFPINLDQLNFGLNFLENMEGLKVVNPFEESLMKAMRDFDLQTNTNNLTQSITPKLSNFTEVLQIELPDIIANTEKVSTSSSDKVSVNEKTPLPTTLSEKYATTERYEDSNFKTSQEKARVPEIHLSGRFATDTVPGVSSKIANTAERVENNFKNIVHTSQEIQNETNNSNDFSNFNNITDDTKDKFEQTLTNESKLLKNSTIYSLNVNNEGELLRESTVSNLTNINPNVTGHTKSDFYIEDKTGNNALNLSDSGSEIVIISIVPTNITKTIVPGGTFADYPKSGSINSKNLTVRVNIKNNAIENRIEGNINNNNMEGLKVIDLQTDINIPTQSITPNLSNLSEFLQNELPDIVNTEKVSTSSTMKSKITKSDNVLIKEIKPLSTPLDETYANTEQYNESHLKIISEQKLRIPESNISSKFATDTVADVSSNVTDTAVAVESNFKNIVLNNNSDYVSRLNSITNMNIKDNIEQTLTNESKLLSNSTTDSLNIKEEKQLLENTTISNFIDINPNVSIPTESEFNTHGKTGNKVLNLSDSGFGVVPITIAPTNIINAIVPENTFADYPKSIRNSSKKLTARVNFKNETSENKTEGNINKNNMEGLKEVDTFEASTVQMVRDIDLQTDINIPTQSITPDLSNFPKFPQNELPDIMINTGKVSASLTMKSSITDSDNVLIKEEKPLPTPLHENYANTERYNESDLKIISEQKLRVPEIHLSSKFENDTVTDVSSNITDTAEGVENNFKSRVRTSQEIQNENKNSDDFSRVNSITYIKNMDINDKFEQILTNESKLLRNSTIDSLNMKEEKELLQNSTISNFTNINPNVTSHTKSNFNTDGKTSNKVLNLSESGFFVVPVTIPPTNIINAIVPESTFADYPKSINNSSKKLTIRVNEGLKVVDPVEEIAMQTERDIDLHTDINIPTQSITPVISNYPKFIQNELPDIRVSTEKVSTSSSTESNITQSDSISIKEENALPKTIDENYNEGNSKVSTEQTFKNPDINLSNRFATDRVPGVSSNATDVANAIENNFKNIIRTSYEIQNETNVTDTDIKNRFEQTLKNQSKFLSNSTIDSRNVLKEKQLLLGNSSVSNITNIHLNVNNLSDSEVVPITTASTNIAKTIVPESTVVDHPKFVSNDSNDLTIRVNLKNETIENRIEGNINRNNSNDGRKEEFNMTKSILIEDKTKLAVNESKNITVSEQIPVTLNNANKDIRILLDLDKVERYTVSPISNTISDQFHAKGNNVTKIISENNGNNPENGDEGKNSRLKTTPEQESTVPTLIPREDEDKTIEEDTKHLSQMMKNISFEINSILMEVSHKRNRSDEDIVTTIIPEDFKVTLSNSGDKPRKTSLKNINPIASIPYIQRDILGNGANFSVELRFKETQFYIPVDVHIIENLENLSINFTWMNSINSRLNNSLIIFLTHISSQYLISGVELNIIKLETMSTWSKYDMFLPNKNKETGQMECFIKLEDDIDIHFSNIDFLRTEDGEIQLRGPDLSLTEANSGKEFYIQLLVGLLSILVLFIIIIYAVILRKKHRSVEFKNMHATA